MPKIYLEKNVLDAAFERLELYFKILKQYILV